MSDPTLFPSIGNIADQTDALQDRPDTPLEPTTDGGETEEKVVQEIESLCMKCHEQGITRMLLTSIPYFKEVIVMSFRCEFCGATNNEIQSAGSIRPEGTVYTARILQRSDLDRQIVRSPHCEIYIAEYELTLPASSRGQLTTVEGLIRDVVADLSMDQPVRRIQDPEGHGKVEALVDNLKEILGDEEDEEEDVDVQVGTAAKKLHLPMPAFTLKLDDPSGNSWIEFVGSMADPKWNMRTYPRTLQQNIDLALVAAPEEQPLSSVQEEQQDASGEIVEAENEEIYVFHGVCSSCGHPLDTLMKKVLIPYFKDVLIMSTNCDRCGYRDNEVKSGSAISDQGKRIILKVEDREDLSRDILKSETAGLEIPEIQLVLQQGTLGGRFTTLEGILDQIYEELSEKVFASGDASDAEGRSTFEAFLGKLKEVKDASRPFTLIIDDPLANSYVQNLYAPDPDPNMVVESYDRTWEQDEELGLNDIKVEGYGVSDEEATPATAPVVATAVESPTS
ncbi:ZPR1 zinc-finger domain-containing protein [Mycena alexandri]|uniref:ZPR1 zinc-finger domain-containing protein n=1 Tax=Mycena alexandri TaxID=1745969 RepID=A0AAD6X9U2_9AGAR|nr:ZPR1 zinc-finger domain-containing protein [Mycena alexandri]KAJ7037419.1 ZPR1 zinc-finger domain-containing protein [Mycena alexandri]